MDNFPFPRQRKWRWEQHMLGWMDGYVRILLSPFVGILYYSYLHTYIYIYLKFTTRYWHMIEIGEQNKDKEREAKDSGRSPLWFHRENMGKWGYPWDGTLNNQPHIHLIWCVFSEYHHFPYDDFHFEHWRRHPATSHSNSQPANSRPLDLNVFGKLSSTCRVGYSPEVDQLAPEDVSNPKRKGIAFQLSFFSGFLLLNNFGGCIWFEYRKPEGF